MWLFNFLKKNVDESASDIVDSDLNNLEQIPEDPEGNDAEIAEDEPKFGEDAQYEEILEPEHEEIQPQADLKETVRKVTAYRTSMLQKGNIRIRASAAVRNKMEEACLAILKKRSMADRRWSE